MENNPQKCYYRSTILIFFTNYQPGQFPMGYELSAKWHIYDHLIDSVPSQATAADAVFGDYWVAILSSLGGAGLAHILPQKDPQKNLGPVDLIGRPLKDIAQMVKSWDETQTAAGLAAVTASANSALLAQGLSPQSVLAGQAAFDHYLELSKNKKVAVIGHFPHLETLKTVAKEFYILERNPEPGDLPDTAAEYLLPDMEVVFITGSSLVNKSLPRLLELSQKARVGLVGPSVPLLPSLFNFSIRSLSGTIFNDYPQVAKAVVEGKTTSLFKYGGFRVNLDPNFSI
jgi:uncharacterized protein (DUF4213/DUF364 family)